MAQLSTKALDLLTHPSELWAAARLVFGRRDLNQLIAVMPPNKKYCYDMLVLICIFYLVLRGLDTVEDDMQYPLDKKLVMLEEFHNKLYDRDFHMDDCGEKHYKDLLMNFQKVNDVFLSLKPGYQKVIDRITLEMARGMKKYLEKEVVTEEEWDDYCHYVAGVVGEGLSELFVASGLQAPGIEKDLPLSNDMGLFLQKVNIVRDYLEDIDEARIFWPKAVWSKYTDKLVNFKDIKHRKAAVTCMNDLITNGLQHAPRCLEYLQQLTDKQIFSFCAIPQVMAIATLALLYNNPEVFEKVVKIRRGWAAKLIVDTTDMASVYRLFYDMAEVIDKKVESSDPNAAKTHEICRKIMAICKPHMPTPSKLPQVVAWSALAVSSIYLLNRHTTLFGGSKL